MPALLRILMLALPIAACSKTGGFDASKIKVNSSSTTSDASSSSTDDQIGHDSLDTPVSVGGAYLVCAAEYQVDGAVSDQAFGCRLGSDKKKVPIPASATAELQLLANGSAVPSTMTLADSSSPWSWLIHTPAKGPFKAKLTLSKVSVTTTPELVVSEGTGRYTFDQATVEGSALRLVPAGGVSVALVPATDSGTFESVSFTTTFPKFLRSSTQAYGSLNVGFDLPSNRVMECVYIPSAGASAFYVLTSDCKDNGVAANFTLDTLVKGAEDWFIELNLTESVAPFTISGSVREFSNE